jgi:alkylation response protein AidB-like acyl-CoA dehydrogenase
MSYNAPIKDMLFNMQHLARIDQIASMPGFEDAGLETAQAVLEECARFNQDVVAPLNWESDKHPSHWKDGHVTTAPGFKQAYKQYSEGGWQGLQHPVDCGGQGLPKTIGAACVEMLNAASLSFALCPLLTDGAIEALLTAGSDDLKATYLDKLVSGEWTGKPTALTKCSAPRFISPMVSTIWPTTSCTWYSHASAARPKVSKASVCLLCLNSW